MSDLAQIACDSQAAAKPPKTGLQEVLDQVAHVVYGIGLMAVCVFPMPVWGATLVTMGIAILRELEQKKWQWRLIGRKDLCFFALSCTLFAGVHYSIEWWKLSNN